MSYFTGPRIVQNGLICLLDAANPKSYVSGSTTWTDISANGNGGTLTNGPGFVSTNGGAITFDGSNDYVTGTAIPSISGNQSRTVCMWFQVPGAASNPVNTALLECGSLTTSAGHQLFAVPISGVNAGLSYNSGGMYVACQTNDIYYPVPQTTLFNSGYHFFGYSYESGAKAFTMCFDGTFGQVAYRWNGSFTPLTGQPFALTTPLATDNFPYWIARVKSALWGIGGVFGNASVAVTQIYNRALGQTELLQNWNALRGRFGS